MKMNEKVKQALHNIDIIIANVKMNRVEHNQLIQDLTLVKQRCELADKLEQKSK